jgi:hypothetical protein
MILGAWLYSWVLRYHDQRGVRSNRLGIGHDWNGVRIRRMCLLGSNDPFCVGLIRHTRATRHYRECGRKERDSPLQCARGANRRAKALCTAYHTSQMKDTFLLSTTGRRTGQDRQVRLVAISILWLAPCTIFLTNGMLLQVQCTVRVSVQHSGWRNSHPLHSDRYLIRIPTPRRPRPCSPTRPN